MTTTYQNPIVPGFAPDPSVVLVDGIFYLVNSSFHLFPGIPVYASDNLKDWKHIGNAINRPEQLSLARAGVEGFPIGGGRSIIAATGLTAPTIRYHEGLFYVICTNVRKEGDHLHTQNFYVATPDIWSNEWSDPIYFDFQGIDPSFYFEDGRAFIQGSWHAGPLSNPMTSIRQFEVELSTGKALSGVKTIWTGHLGKSDAEGPHIYKKDGYYYLLVAEGGTWQHHCITMARSTDIWGPYETYAENPVLTADGKDEYIQYTGHGDLFQDGIGNWWAVHLGIRDGEGGRSPLGRETFLTPVSWPEGGWPKIQQTRITFDSVTVEGQAGAMESLQKDIPPDVDCLYLRTPEASDYEISSDGSKISLVPRDTGLSVQEGTCTFLTQRQRGLICTATVTLDLQREKNEKNAASSVKAGILLFKDDIRHVDLYYDFQDHSIHLVPTDKIEHESNPVFLFEHHPSEKTTRITFEIRASAKEYTFFFRDTQDGNEDLAQVGDWVFCGSVDTMRLTAWDFAGTCFGIFASSVAGDGKTEDGSAYEKAGKVLFEGFKVV